MQTHAKRYTHRLRRKTLLRTEKCNIKIGSRTMKPSVFPVMILKVVFCHYLRKMIILFKEGLLSCIRISLEKNTHVHICPHSFTLYAQVKCLFESQILPAF